MAVFLLLGHGEDVLDEEAFQAAGVDFGLVLFLPFHAAVLKPDLDLPLGEAERVSDLDPSPARQVAIEVELLFQFERLEARVRLAAAFSFRYGEKEKEKTQTSN